MLLSIVHLRNKLLDYQHNFNNVLETYLRSVAENVDLVIYPESALSGYAVIDSNSMTWMDKELNLILSLFKHVRNHNVPLVIGGHFYDATYNSVEAYFLITPNKIQILKTKKRHNCFINPTMEIDNNGVLFSINGIIFSTLICSESMCVNMLDSAISKCDILLNPSAYGETKDPENYPLISTLKEFDDKLIIVPNLSMEGDEYQYGRTLIKRGNNILYELSALTNTVIVYNTETGEIYERH